MAHSFETLIAMSPAALEDVLNANKAPAFSSLVAHEFRGWNVFGDALAKGVGTVMGIQRFAKGFFLRDAPVGGVDDAAAIDALTFIEGYNVKIRRGTKDEPWTAIPDDARPTRHSYYRVERAHEGAERKGRHPEALLLDYSQGIPKPGLFEGSGLRDFVVSVDGNPDLLLGKAYMTIGPVTSAVGFFVAERLRQVDPLAWRSTT
ncbi:MAG TPA: hypothetical protein VGF99_17095 [Myxococcota bacterium]